MKLVFKFTVIVFLFMAASCGAKTESKQLSTLEISDDKAAELDTAYFAGGCFWCIEAIFERVKGVEAAVSGYSGGDQKNPTYHEVSYGKTNHAESVKVFFDPKVVSYKTLVEIFFGSIDPTQLNRQGPDVGKQYRSAVFYKDNGQKQIATEVKNRLNQSEYNGKIVTEITKFKAFYDAEDYHQGYYEIHPDDPYVRSVSKPKVEKFMKHFKDKLKEEYQ
ncbi:peptide-methionine (S)-S-oxide reductase MsrA [Fulvivirga sediminis]|uniref:Peptide methionine sulfoxide reductase MsrA n=1 Tax=Fulvivirga sediminis TaxID=2803949 RepID=A0A937JXK7_9BACT|nr:peptide-methionine (S)-S-oxide reductase MsrA [Fulvivirga sediminis]MBL3654729.1 peptide-methionine (S)-S-oxide reductase MsrA [Fulvivirga sediminis]